VENLILKVVNFMSQIITYKCDSSGKYCQIKLDDGNRILISIAQEGAKIFKLKWGGLWPSETIFNISTNDLFSDEYKFARERLTERSFALDMLDVFKEILIQCKSLEEVREELNKIFTKKEELLKKLFS